MDVTPINHPLKTKDNKEEVVVLSLCPEEIYCLRADKTLARVYVLFKERNLDCRSLILGERKRRARNKFPSPGCTHLGVISSKKPL
jgi:hypothetical protein